MARNQSCRQNFVPSGSCASFRSQPGLRDAGFSLKIDRAGPAGLKWRISPCLQTSKLTRHLRSAGMKKLPQMMNLATQRRLLCG